MKMERERIIEKWMSCKFSLNFGLFAGDEAGYALREEGYNENYGCEQPEIVNSGRFQVTSFPEGEKIIRAASLHGMGKDEDPSVIAALTNSCENCPFYQKDSSKI